MDVGVISYCATAESVTLFWDKPEYAAGMTHYQVLLNGIPAGSSDRTHFTVTGLIPNTEYRAEVQTGGTILGSCEVRTGPRLQRLNVRDFGASGNGEAMDTAALQRAIDACRADQEVYLPAGRYCTRALRLHSDMALYLDEDAVLQGTDVPEDYLPRISGHLHLPLKGLRHVPSVHRSCQGRSPSVRSA